MHEGTADEYRSFAVVQLDVAHDAVTPVGLTLLAYQSVRAPRSPEAVPLLTRLPACSAPTRVRSRARDCTSALARLPSSPSRTLLSSPRLSPVRGALSVCPASVLTARAADASFEEAFPLRQNSTRFLGLSMPSYLYSPPSSTETLSLLTSSPSLLTVSVSAPHHPGQRVAPSAGGLEALKTHRLKTRLEQAIFYGTREAENPLAFDIQPDFEGDLAKAATAVSADILASSALLLLFRARPLLTFDPDRLEQHAPHPRPPCATRRPRTPRKGSHRVHQRQRPPVQGESALLSPTGADDADATAL